MAVMELTPGLLEPFLKFSKKFEHKSISLMSRMYKKDIITVPSPATARIFCELSDLKPDYILNAIMISSGGMLLPMFSEIPPSDIVLKEMLTMITDYKKKIFCILGVSKDTGLIKNFLYYSILSKINYVLLIEDDNNIFNIDKTMFTVKKAKKRDAVQLFPLEKAYLLEEVLVKSSTVNQQAALINLRKTCNFQSVFFAISGNEVIAKVNTNGKGIAYNQIGGVYTLPEFRSRGISTWLMKILLNEIHISGNRAVLYVKKENKPALALYKKLGFRIIDEYSAIYIKP